MISGCGLPLYEILDQPIPFYTSGDSVVGFTTPDDDQIDGYVVYYKIYNYQESLARQEELLFDPDYYESSKGDELPEGDDLPQDLDFYKLGFTGRNSVIYPQIIWSGSGNIIQIDFTDALNQDTGFDPSILIDGTDYTSTYGIPARYVKYSSSSIPTAWNGTFKRFVKNYRYYEDKDIIDVRSRNGGTVSSNIEIAFVAISYGISDSNLEPVMSIPVYLGRVQQQSMSNASDIPVWDTNL